MISETFEFARNISFSDPQSESNRDLSDLSEAARGLWVMHGMLMGVAWGILAPLAISAAYLRRNLSFLEKDARWLRVHFVLCVLVALLTFAGFVVAVMATLKDGEEIFDDDFHHMAGFAIVALVLVQGLAGYFRPSPIPVASLQQIHAKDSDVETSKDISMDAVTVEVQGNVENSGKAWNKRKVWEYTHRLMGVLLLGLAWCNCHTGIMIQADEYAQYDEGSLLGLFWGITGAIIGIILLVGIVSRVLAF